MSDPKSLQRLRKCGKLEQFSTARHHLGFYNNVGVTVSYFCSGSTVSLRSLCFHVLRTVIQRHSILSAIPVDEDTNSPYFARLPAVDLRTCVYFIERKTPVPDRDSNDEELDAILEEQHNTNFKEYYGERPFWRLIILHAPGSTTQFSASWIYHHAIGDGTSGLVFHRDFSAALQSIPGNSLQSSPDEVNSNSDPIVPSPSEPLLPALEDLHPLPLSMAYLAKQQWRDWFPKKTTGLWVGNKIPTLDLTATEPKIPRMHFRSLVLSQENTRKLADASREHKVTVTATLQCLVAAAMFANLYEKKWSRLHVDGAVSLRRFLKLDGAQRPIDEQIGSWVSQYLFDHRRQASKESRSDSRPNALKLFSWEEAQAVKSSIKQELDKNMKDSVVNLLRWVPDVHGLFTRKMGRERTESFELSNVGIFAPRRATENDGATEEHWTVGRCVFSQSASIAGAALLIGVVTGGDGCAVLSFNWLEGAVEGQWIDKVMKTLTEGVAGLVGD